jgi:dinuclear metal center YbgI/SA1388 family protein
VDASLEAFKQAAAVNAGMIFVHHGLFYGASARITGFFRERIKFLLDNNICLYGVHLPLDHHPQFGNNIVLAELLGLENIEPFGFYKNGKIGYKGTFPSPMKTEEAVKRISFMGRPPLGIYQFGKSENKTAAIASGGCSSQALNAIEEGVDLYVTGEILHQVYHDCLEGKLNMISGGHYSTEVWGLQAVMKHCRAELGIEVEFIDVPTGL